MSADPSLTFTPLTADERKELDAVLAKLFLVTFTNREREVATLVARAAISHYAALVQQRDAELATLRADLARVTKEREDAIYREKVNAQILCEDRDVARLRIAALEQENRQLKEPGRCRKCDQPDLDDMTCSDCVYEQAERIAALESALKALRIDANRLCDRNQGGSYEDDCRLSIKNADDVLQGGA